MEQTASVQAVAPSVAVAPVTSAVAVRATVDTITVTPATPSIAVSATATALTITPITSAVAVEVTPGAATFLALPDTPDTYVGQGGKAVAVKSDASGLEFVSGGGGSVTSVTATSPLTASGGAMPDISIANQSANRVLAGPTSGGAAAPTFRALVAGDIPDLSGSYQPLDSDLTAIAALSTTSYGRSLLTVADAAAGRTLLSLGTAATHADTDFALLAAANTFTLGPNLFRAGANGNVALTARRHSSSATANIFEVQNESGTALAYATKDAWLVAPRIAVGNPNFGFNFSGYIADNYFNIDLTIPDIVGAATHTHYHNIFNFSANIQDTTNSSIADAQIFGYSGYLGIYGTRIPNAVYGFLSVLDHETAINGVATLTGFENDVYAYGGGTIGEMTAYRTQYFDNGSGANIDLGAILYAPSINSSGGTFSNLYGIYLGNVVGGTSNNYAIYTAGGETRHKTGGATIVGLSVQAAASQSADLVRLLASDGTTIQHRYNKDGYWITNRHSAPADGDLGAGDMALWFDQTNGAAKLKIKAKQADGTVRTGEVALA